MKNPIADHSPTVVVIPNQDESAVDEGASLDPWRTELGRLLAAARAEYFAANGRFLTRDEFEREWEQERGVRRWTDDG